MVLGLLGVLSFSMSLPATRVAVGDLDPWFVAFGRAVGAGLLALAYLAVTRAPRPTAAQWRRLAVVALGVVVGFPLFTSLALVTSSASHGAVVVALLPAITAGFAVVRSGERPTPAFWIAGGAGLAAVLVFLVASGAVRGAFGVTDLFLLTAVTLCGLGYAEGGALARDLGGARTICWALVLSLPATTAVTMISVARQAPHASAAAWAGFSYVTVISMFLGFFAWYAGLARGGVARVGQVQLLQPLLTLTWSGLVLGEHVGVGTVIAAGGVLAAVVVTQRARIASAQPTRSRCGPTVWAGSPAETLPARKTASRVSAEPAQSVSPPATEAARDPRVMSSAPATAHARAPRWNGRTDGAS